MNGMPRPGPPPAPGDRRIRRGRHGRGRRGLLAWPPVPAMTTRREQFDEIVRDVAEDLDRILEPRGLVVEYATMDVPTDLGHEWAPEVPLARTIAPTKSTPARIIAFRRPIEGRAGGQGAMSALVRAALTAEISALFAIPPEQLDAPDDDL